jgi:hypothetical protein
VAVQLAEALQALAAISWLSLSLSGA